ncbi:MAG TPA: alpha/beta hydrolase [Acetobacteraceae bacterium]
MASRVAALPEPDEAKASGPAVWLDMDQQALDDAYDQSKYALNRTQIVERYASNSDIARERLGAPRRIAYGPTADEALDLYPAATTNAPISIFLHGGAWQRGLAKNYAFAAELFVRAGAHHVVPDFINVIEAGGDLMPMADQVRRAIAWVYRNAARFGGDSNRIHLYGHSSGAHLAAAAMVTDWRGAYDLPADVIKTGLLCSGMYDLRPVRLSARSRYVNFTDDMEAALSAQRHIDRFTAPVVLAFGTSETPEFQRQSRDFAAALRAAGKRVKLLVGNHYNHFEIVETLASPYGLLGRAALAQIAGA